MKERPILFSGPMVRALLDGSKTQTRRVAKGVIAAHAATGEALSKLDSAGPRVPCPYGQPGDRLWVRETFVQGWTEVNGILDQYDDEGNEKPKKTWYRATAKDFCWLDDDGFMTEAVPWKPSIHMPRAASRITLEITGVRVERLQDISEADALAEGIHQQSTTGWFSVAGINGAGTTARAAYALLWNTINGHASWMDNPWVWVVNFKRVV